ncbi:ATP-binding protein [Streptomyces profundus]|uniref:ATP-binding protein n=1 Tax=Streptomyces profundus TaxID=2867410 RepID=UPI001D15ED8D|nr:ATP-binding protein [Streptomyces sp. MA3_2.13]UED85587.1 ATP-binding protein [Streptomyces sp. MA3_2.13]
MGTEATPLLDELGLTFLPVDPRGVSASASVDLAPRPESVRQAREFTRRTLKSWSLAEHFDAVALVVSELVTNALRHGMGRRTLDWGHGTGPMRTDLELELLCGDSWLVCAVRDPSESAPRPALADSGAEGGRGLHLVDSFSDDWGWRRLTGDARGKIVWARFGTD